MTTSLKLVEPDIAPAVATVVSLSDAVRPFLADFAKWAPDTEKARMVSAEAIGLLRQAGFFRALAPRKVGGDERSLADFCRGIRQVARHCPSTAWVTGVLAVHPAGIGHYDQRAQEEFWSMGPDTISSSSGSPTMKAVLVEGGVRVTGRGRWSSGCDHARWAMVGLKVPDLSNRHYSQHRYTDYMALVPRDDYSIDDTWYSTGLRGTGSKDLVFDNVFIPHYRMERMEALMFGFGHGAGTHDGWMSKVPFPILFGIFLPAVALGCADGMVAEFTKRQKTRKNAYTGAQGILSVPGYMRLAESTHELESLTLHFEDLLRALEEHGREGRRVHETVFVNLQAKFPFITRRAMQVLDRLFEAAGASAMADFNPMQRYWRDGHTAALHLGSDYDIQMQMHGRTLMGLMMDPNL